MAENAFVRVSPSWTVLLGHDEEILLSRPYAEIVHPDDFPVVMEALLDMRATGRPVRFEDRIKAADGTWRWVAWKLAPEPGGERLTGIGRDVSLRYGLTTKVIPQPAGCCLKGDFPGFCSNRIEIGACVDILFSKVSKVRANRGLNSEPRRRLQSS